MDGKQIGLLLLLVGGAAAALAYSQSASANTGDTTGNAFDNLLNDLTGGFTMGSWKTGEYPKYASAISDAERRWGIPTDLLARVLYQESRYRADVIAGTNRSPVGAIGIAQFMPDTAAQYGVDPYDPFSSIEGAAHYLHDLYNMFGDWRSALMAYNWGPGNVRKYNQGQSVTVPIETSTYVAQITADVPVA